MSISTRAAADLSASRTSNITVALCYCIALFEGFDLQAAGVAAPMLGPAFHMSPGQLGWFFSASTFGLMAGAACGGRLSDRIGRKTVLIFSVSVFGLMSVLTGLAHRVDGLLIARFFTGFGIGGALPNLVALTAENTLPERRHTSVGLLYAGLPSGGALASLTSALVSTGGWQTVFFAGGLAPLVAVPLLVLLLPESRQLRAARRAHITEQPGHHGFVYALFSEERAARSMLLWMGFFLALLTMYLILNWLPTLLVTRGLTRADASLVQLSFNVFGACASAVTGMLMDRLSMRMVVVASFVSAAVSLLLLSVAPPQLVISIVVGGLVGITMSATQAALYSIAPANYPTEVRGTGVGTAVSIGRLGSAVGPLLAAVLVGSGKSPQDVLMILVPTILLSGAAVFALTRLMERAALHHH
jgi:AAHS family 3-hydroxyphenylpropionic acid transporter